MNARHYAVCVLMLGFCSLVLCVNPAAAAERNWKQNAGSTAWATDSNWDEGTAPANDITSDTAVFNKPSYSQQPNAGTRSVNGISVGSSSANLTISTTTLTIGDGGVSVAAGAGTVTLNAAGGGNITLGANQTWVNNCVNVVTINRTLNLSSYALTFDGPGNFTHSSAGDKITGAGGSLVLASTYGGTVTLARTGCDYTGGVTIKAGMLDATAGDGNVFGTGTVTLGDTAANSKDAILKRSNTAAVGRPITVTSANQTKRIVGGVTGVLLEPSEFTVNGDVTVETAAGGSSTLNLGKLSQSPAKKILGSGTITCAGPGTINLLFDNSACDYSGQLKVTAGTVKIGHFNTLPRTNVVSVASGATFDMNNLALALGGLNDISGAGGTVLNSGGSDRTLTLSNSADCSFSGVIAPATLTRIALAKAGAGTQTLGGSNTYTGATTVNGGRLNVNGSLDSVVTVNNGGTLGGNGVLNKAVTVNGGGILAAGASVGTLTLAGNLTMGSDSVTAWEKGPGAHNADKVVVLGNLSIASQTTVKVVPLPGATPGGEGETNTVFQVSGTLTGFNNLVLDTSETAGWSGDLVQDGNNVLVVLVPEPAALGLLCLALALRARRG